MPGFPMTRPRGRGLALAVSALMLVGSAPVVAATAAADTSSGAAPAPAAPAHRHLYVGGFASPAIAGAAVTRNGAMRPVSGTPFPSGPNSLGMAITPDGRTLYSVSAGLQLSSLAVVPGTITAYRIGDDGVLRETAETTAPGPVIGAAVTPDGKRLFVTVSTGSTGQVLSYDIASSGALTPTGAAPAAVPSGISQVVISPDARHLYVSNFLTNSMSSFAIAPDAGLTSIGEPLATGAQPAIPSISPDGRYLYVGNEGSGDLSGYVIGKDGALTPAPGSPYASGATPHGPIFSPDSRRLYVANASGNTISGWQVGDDGRLSPLPGSPFASPDVARVVLSPDAKVLYAMTGAPRKSGKVSSFAVRPDGGLTPTGYPALDTGLFWHDGSNAFLTPNQGPAAALRADGDSRALTRTFTAAGSSDPDGRVVRYRWDFGDGAVRTTTTPRVTHRYATAGARTVSVTVTDDEGCSTALVYNGTTVECRGGAQARATEQVVVGRP
ncbi:beta-propeller fold lactonase family protein [Streptomyces sp. SID8499]|uniref:beta-propeller fold lactonase family protein n=1 Tax=unclassified Streptomyces TaxID=2593676 RepID=UPI0013C8EF10|nr:beta-propeller fold lactonase family protein [Streptomyces sp. SID8499]